METENGALVQRLIQLKATEVERMNEVNRVCEEMVGCPAYCEAQCWCVSLYASNLNCVCWASSGSQGQLSAAHLAC